MNFKIKSMVYYVLIALVVLGLGYSVSGGAKSIFAVGDTGLTRTKYIEAPSFAFLECGELDSKSILRSFGAEPVEVSCKEDTQGTLLGMSDGCTLTLIAPDDGFKVARRNYEFQEWDEDLGWGISKSVEGGIAGYSGETETLTLNSNTKIRLVYTSLGDLKSEGQKYRVTGNQYGIKNYNSLSSSNGQLLPSARVGSCVLEDNYYKSRKLEYADPGIVELQGRDNTFNFDSLNKPNGVYTYFSHFTPVPGFDSKIETLNGEEVYCMNNALYSTLNIKVDGFTYNIVNYDKSGKIKDVDCCNGDEKPGFICNDHAWIKQSEAVCDISQGKFCPQSTFQPDAAKTFKRFVCEGGLCVVDKLEVKCAYDSDCNMGEVCVRNDNPSKNYCVAGGSGTQTTSPEIPEGDEWMWPVLILISSVMLGIVISKGKKKGWFK